MGGVRREVAWEILRHRPKAEAGARLPWAWERWARANRLEGRVDWRGPSPAGSSYGKPLLTLRGSGAFPITLFAPTGGRRPWTPSSCRENTVA